MNRKSKWISSLGAVALIATLGFSVASSPASAIPATGNLFDGSLSTSDGARLYHSAGELDQKIGISANGTVVYNGSSPAGAYYTYMWAGPLYNERINPSNNQREAYIYASGGGNDVRTEGMGWAMMIAVQGNDQYRFDLLRNFIENHMRQNPQGYYNWHTDTNGNLINGDNGCAPDGDEWITTALIMATHRWNDNKYINEAWGNLYRMANNGSGGSRMFIPGTDLVDFGPGYAEDHSDASYVQPAFYSVWYDATGKNNSNYSPWISATGGDNNCWNSVTNASRSYLNNSASITQNGYKFHPDQTGFNGASWGSSYSYDAWRTPMNAAIDAGWNGQGTTYWNFCRDRQDYYYYQNPRRFGNGSTGELAINACAGEGYNWSNSERADFARALYQAGAPGDYYSGILYFLGLLVTSGRFKYY